MRIRAKRRIQWKGSTYNVGEVFDFPDHDAQDLIKQGHAEKVEPENETQEEDSGDASDK
jgi:hypothetical protein